MYDIIAIISDVVGIVGVVLILSAYLLISTGKWTAVSMIFQSFNFIGAWFILFSLYFHWNLASVVIEIAWILISMLGMYRAWMTQKSRVS